MLRCYCALYVGNFTHALFPHLQLQNGRTPLHYAVVEGKMNNVEILVRAPGADVNIADTVSCFLCLSVLCCTVTVYNHTKLRMLATSLMLCSRT